MALAPIALLPSATGTAATLIALPVLVAALTAAATMLVTRAGEATNRRRDRYAQAVQTLVAWIEFPYRVRRRTDDNPSTLKALVDLGHDLQELLACHQAWIATEHPQLADAYASTRATLTTLVGPAINEAWETRPAEKPADMNLGDWGPAGPCHDALAELQRKIENRFGHRRITASLKRLAITAGPRHRW